MKKLYTYFNNIGGKGPISNINYYYYYYYYYIWHKLHVLNSFILILRVPLDIILWIFSIFNNNLGIENDFTIFVRRVVGKVLVNISPTNIFPNMFSLERFYQNSNADVSINRLYITCPHHTMQQSNCNILFLFYIIIFIFNSS